MSLAEVLPAVRALPRSEKLRLVELIESELAEDEARMVSETEAVYSVWSPYGAFEAGDVLLRALCEDEARKDD